MIVQTVLFFWALVDSVSGETLILSQILWRHGDRSPIALFPNYPRPADVDWPMGLGCLTPRGIEQHFQLGRQLRKKYKYFLNETYLASEITVMSSDVDRTIMSAQANMAGLYPPQGWQRWNETNELGRLWQPVPVHVDKAGYLLSPGCDCPAFWKEKTWTEKNLPFAINNTAENGTIMDYILQRSGNASLRIGRIADTVYCARQHKYLLPEWIAKNKTVLGFLNFVYESYDPTLYMSTDKLVRLGGGPLLGTMIRNMENKIANNVTNKMFVYSAHDTTVMSLLAALNVFQVHLQPHYFSTVLVELFAKVEGSQDPSDYTVAVYFLRGGGEPDLTRAKLLKIPFCEERCPLKRFKRILSYNIPVDRSKECASDGGGLSELLQDPSRDTIVLFLSLLVSLLVAILFFSCVFFLVRQRRGARPDYRRFSALRFSPDDDGEAALPLAHPTDDGETYGYVSG